jgi:hypothetical protein
MARQIDFSKPLDAQDKQYLRERPWLINEANARGDDTSTVWEDSLELPDPTITVTTEEASLGNSDRRLPGPAPHGLAPLEDQMGEPPMGADYVDDEPYENWTVADLQGEIDARNSARSDDDKISRSGKKDELVARLYEDDKSA